MFAVNVERVFDAGLMFLPAALPVLFAYLGPIPTLEVVVIHFCLLLSLADRVDIKDREHL